MTKPLHSLHFIWLFSVSIGMVSDAQPWQTWRIFFFTSILIIRSIDKVFYCGKFWSFSCLQLLSASLVFHWLLSFQLLLLYFFIVGDIIWYCSEKSRLQQQLSHRLLGHSPSHTYASISLDKAQTIVQSCSLAILPLLLEQFLSSLRRCALRINPSCLLFRRFGMLQLLEILNLSSIRSWKFSRRS